MSDISPSKLEKHMTPEMEAAIAACDSAEEITALLHATEAQLGFRKADALNPSLLLEVTEPVAQRETAYIEVGGQKKWYEWDTADGDAGKTAAQLESMREIFGEGQQQQQQTQKQQTTEKEYWIAQDPTTGKFRDSFGRWVPDDLVKRYYAERNQSAIEASQEADLKMRLMRGEISLTDALEQVENKVLARREQRSWAESTELFLNSPAGEMWPGGEANLERLGNKLAELGLTGAPSVESLAAAWQSMQEEDAAVEQQKADAGFALDFPMYVARAARPVRC